LGTEEAGLIDIEDAGFMVFIMLGNVTEDADLLVLSMLIFEVQKMLVFLVLRILVSRYFEYWIMEISMLIY